MDTNNTVIINGKKYDAESGLLIGSVSEQRITQTRDRIRSTQAKSSNQMHARLQRSQTLRRRSVNAPQVKLAESTPTPAAATIQKRSQQRQPVARPDIARSPMISRFSDHNSAKPASDTHRVMVKNKPKLAQAADQPFKAHPVAAKTSQRLASQQQPDQPSIHSQPASVVKQAMINQAMAEAPSSKQNQRAHRSRRKKQAKKSFRFMSFATASLAVVMLGGYFSYLAMPNLSVRVAAIQSGVDATYPGFKPNGYSLDGPVAYTGGQVSMDFKANGGTQGYSLTQTNSNWDSSAVESNYVQPDVGDDYTVTQKQGLTIYTYGNGQAAWVNKGVFYSLQGDAPLSTSQIARIATSM